STSSQRWDPSGVGQSRNAATDIVGGLAVVALIVVFSSRRRPFRFKGDAEHHGGMLEPVQMRGAVLAKLAARQLVAQAGEHLGHLDQTQLRPLDGEGASGARGDAGTL